MAKCSALFHTRHSPRISHAPWKNGLPEVEKNSWKPSESVSA